MDCGSFSRGGAICRLLAVGYVTSYQGYVFIPLPRLVVGIVGSTSMVYYLRVVCCGDVVVRGVLYVLQYCLYRISLTKFRLGYFHVVVQCGLGRGYVSFQDSFVVVLVLCGYGTLSFVPLLGLMQAYSGQVVRVFVDLRVLTFRWIFQGSAGYRVIRGYRVLVLGYGESHLVVSRVSYYGVLMVEDGL